MIEALLVTLGVGITLYLLIALKSTKSLRRRGGRLDRELVARKWAEVEAMAASNRWAQAVTEADKLLDYAMKHSGFRGETMGERLKSGGRRFSDINGVWRAHKLRNAIAHEVGHDIVPSQAREALRDFERGLRDLGAL